MNLADLQATGGFSPLTVIFIVAALCGLFALVTGMLNDDPPAATLGILCLGAFGLLAFNNAVDDYYESKTPAFTRQLQEDYGLETTTHLRKLVETAEDGGTVTMSEEKRIIDVRVVKDKGTDFLKFYRVPDGELLQPRS